MVEKLGGAGYGVLVFWGWGKQSFFILLVQNN
jgi:hypothetical protein